MSLIRKPSYELFAVLITDIKKTLKLKKYTNLFKKVSKKYYEFLDVFSQKEADKLLEHHSYNHKIKLEFGKQLSFKSMYEMSLDELKCLQKYLNEHLTKDFIKASKSPVAASVLFAKKPGEGLQFCVNYQALNAITVKNHYSISLIQETLNCLSKAQYYMKFDIIAIFNQIHIAKEDK